MQEMVRFPFRFGLAFILLLGADAELSVPGFDFQAYVKRGQINIGMITYVHRFSADDFCAPTVWNTAALRTEVASYITNVINQDVSLLPNVSLGFVVVDGCLKDLTALATSLYLVRPVQNRTPADYGLEGDLSVIGIVGPTTSRQAVMVSSFLGLFHVPTLSTTATSDELSDKHRFPYFMRLVPADMYQASAILDIVQYFGWSYVSLLYSEGSYGENGAKNVERLAKFRRQICLAMSKRVPSDAKQADFDQIVSRLASFEHASAVIVIMEGKDTYSIFRAVKKANLTERFRWIGSDSFWTIRETEFEQVSIGALYIDFPSGTDDPGFRRHLETVSWLNSTNPWVSVLFEAAFGCSWLDVADNNSCAQYKSLGEAADLPVPAVGKHIDGFLVYARALHKLISDRCPDLFSGDVSELPSCVSGSVLLEYMRNVTFDGYSEHIAFDDKGDMNGSYLIRQLRPAGKEGRKSSSVVIGEWNKSTGEVLRFDSRVAAEWNDKRNLLLYPVSSACSKPCQPGYYYQIREVACCWDCIQCRDNEITVDNMTSCRVCPAYSWPDTKTKSTCEPIEPTYLRMDSTVGMLLFASGLIGLLAAVALVVIYRIKRDNRLLKATSLQLSVFMFFGCMMACVVSLLYEFYPTDAICILRQTGFHLSVSVIYSPLLAKTARVYRIFRAAKKGTTRPKFISTNLQLLFTSILVLIQVVVLISLQTISPVVSILHMPSYLVKYVEATCSVRRITFLLPLVNNLVLICACAVIGFLTRKLPENFNDSHYIFVSTSTTLFMWSVFLPTHFTVVQSDSRDTLLSLCLQVNSYVLMCVQFGPKIYATFCLNEDDISFNTTGMSTRVQHSSR